MDTIELIREIEEKIRKAEEYLPVLIETFQKQEGIKLTYRIKDKKHILEKVMLFSKSPKLQDMDEKQILDEVIGDIIGLTIVVDNLDDSFEVADKIKSMVEEERELVKLKKRIDHISDNGGPTGYKDLLLQFDSEEGIPFEVQVTDKENLIIRESTHEEFEKIKYGKVRELPDEKKVEDRGKE